MTTRAFRPGFRLSIVDAIVLLAGATATAIAFNVDPGLAAAIAFVVAHFFLFCNVLRMERSLELLWSAAFVALAGATIATGLPGWPATFGLSLAVTIVVAVAMTRRESYHGVGWRRLNPKLPDWWAARSPPEEPATLQAWRAYVGYRPQVGWLACAGACVLAAVALAVAAMTNPERSYEFYASTASNKTGEYLVLRVAQADSRFYAALLDRSQPGVPRTIDFWVYDKDDRVPRWEPINRMPLTGQPPRWRDFAAFPPAPPGGLSNTLWVTGFLVSIVPLIALLLALASLLVLIALWRRHRRARPGGFEIAPTPPASQ